MFNSESGIKYTPVFVNQKENMPVWGLADNSPVSASQVFTQTDQDFAVGKIKQHLPVATGFEPLDQIFSGGLRKGDLVLVGGAQGIGKTVFTLQMARNIVTQYPDYVSFYVCFEHPPKHLVNRLLCLESVDFEKNGRSKGMKLKDLRLLMQEAEKARQKFEKEKGAPAMIGFQDMIMSHPAAYRALRQFQNYSNRLVLMKGSPTVTTAEVIHSFTRQLIEENQGKVVLFIDYLQKVSTFPEKHPTEAEKVTTVVESLKEIAMSLQVPVVSVVAADREGLKSRRMHVHHLRGSSAIDYESDIVLIMNNKYKVLSKEHIAYNLHAAEKYRHQIIFSVEKNRSGPGQIDLEYDFYGPHFCFNPQGRKVEQRLIDEKIIKE